MKSGQTTVDLLWAKQENLLFQRVLHISPSFYTHPSTLLSRPNSLFPTHCCLRRNAIILQKTTIWFYSYSQELGEEREGMEACVYQDLAERNWSKYFHRAPHCWCRLEFGRSAMYPSGRSHFLSLPPRSQQTQNVTVNFYNPQQPRSDYLIPWKY